MRGNWEECLLESEKEKKTREHGQREKMLGALSGFLRWFVDVKDSGEVWRSREIKGVFVKVLLWVTN